MASQDLTPEALAGFVAQLDGKPAPVSYTHLSTTAKDTAMSATTGFPQHWQHARTCR